MMCGLSWGSSEKPTLAWFNDKLVNVIVQAGLKKQAELGGRALALDSYDPEKLQILKLLLTTPGNGAPVCCFRPISRPTAKARLISAFRASHA